MIPSPIQPPRPSLVLWMPWESGAQTTHCFWSFPGGYDYDNQELEINMVFDINVGRNLWVWHPSLHFWLKKILISDMYSCSSAIILRRDALRSLTAVFGDIFPVRPQLFDRLSALNSITLQGSLLVDVSSPSLSHLEMAQYSILDWQMPAFCWIFSQMHLAPSHWYFDIINLFSDDQNNASLSLDFGGTFDAYATEASARYLSNSATVSPQWNASRNKLLLSGTLVCICCLLA